MYKPKCVLLTGGAGFIGSNTTIRLVKNHPKVHFTVLDKLDYCSNIKNLDPVRECKNFTFIRGNILSSDLVNHIVKTHAVDTIYHFAAQTHVDNSFGNSLTFTRNNVLGTHTLLECWKQNQSQIKRFIHVSTDEVYGENKDSDATDNSFDEDGSRMSPTNPYAASKAAAEILVKSYMHSFNLPGIITRGNNVYGPRQFPEKLIPKFIQRMERKMKLCIHGDGSPKRSYLYVDDAAKAYETILFRGKIGEVYNVGTEKEIKVIDVANRILDAYQIDHSDRSNHFEFVPDRHFNDQRYFISVLKLRRLDWKPEINMEEGLHKTIQWYRQNPNHWESQDIERSIVPHPRR